MDRPVASGLEKLLRTDAFAVTAELLAVDSTDPVEVLVAARQLAAVCDAVNVTDGSGAVCHMSSLAASALLVRDGIETVMQLSCRDRNRIALQSDLIGASALGIRNVLCITGDDVTVGDHPGAMRVFDLDAIQLLNTARHLRDEGSYLSGRPIPHPPALFLGAAANRFAPPLAWRPHRLAKKVEAGARFVQTQFCFDVDRLRAYMGAVAELGLLDQVRVLVGVGPLRSAAAAERIRSHIPGVTIPDPIIARLRSVPSSEQQAEGIEICVETIQTVREIPGVSGVHIMAFRHPEDVVAIADKANLLPRPKNKE